MLREELDARTGVADRRAADAAGVRRDSGSASTTPSTARRRSLGVDGLALIGHGRSSARAVESGIAMAARLAEARVVETALRVTRCAARRDGAVSAVVGCAAARGLC